MSERGEVTRLLEAWRGGKDDAAEELLPLVYDELRRIARAVLTRERRHHPLQPTALVHEAFLRLVVQRRARISGRSHFLSVAARAMRRILVEQERHRRAEKRGGSEIDLPLIEAGDLAVGPQEPELLDLHDALKDLGVLDNRKAHLVELRFFAGLSMPEAAEVLGVSLATAERDWMAARLWLRRRLAGSESSPADGEAR